MAGACPENCKHWSQNGRQRIELAAKIAIAYLHFASVNKGFAHRQLRSYRYFRGADKPHDWNTPFAGMPWLDYGFGSPVQKSGRVSLNAPAPLDSSKIDPALELGVLLYQITSCSKIPYGNTIPELKRAGEEAKSSLNKILDVSGVLVKEIVETCFESCPENHISSGEEQDPSFVVIEEVASALRHHVNLLRKGKAGET